VGVSVSRFCEDARYGAGIGGYAVALHVGAEMGRGSGNGDRAGGDR